jgi:hypothetical protein
LSKFGAGRCAYSAAPDRVLIVENSRYRLSLYLEVVVNGQGLAIE